MQLLDRVERDLIVIFELVGCLGDTGRRYRAEIVIPPVDALAGLSIIRRPAEVGRIDVGGQPFLESMQLIRPDEVHLARQAGVITCAAKMMREGRDR